MLGKSIKNLIKKSDRLYVIARCIRNINDPSYWKLVKGYYEVCDYSSLFIEHKGEKYPDKIIYHIGFYIPDKKNPVRSITGLCALLRMTLLSMSFADALGIAPVVEWGSNCAYYDPNMDPITLNVFEYYFEPVSNICSSEIEDCKNVVDMIGFPRNMVNSFFFVKRASDMFASYHVKQEEIERLACLYRKYIHLNTKTQKYIEDQMNEILDEEPILGVHIRGTDFNLVAKNHPIVVTAEEYLETAKQVFAGGKYKKVFLATDDANALELFKAEFKDELLYFVDTFRSADHNGAQVTFSDRPFHHYRLGLEVLRDIYTLANCNSLVCGLSQVPLTAQYVNLAIGRKYNEVVVIDHGVYKKSSPEAVKNFKNIRRENKHDLHKNP